MPESAAKPDIAGTEEPVHHVMISWGQKQKRLAWEITAIILICCIISVVAIDLVINRDMLWSEYPVAISLAIFSYISTFAFLSRNRFLLMLFSMLLAAIFLLLIDFLAGELTWALPLGIPMLIATNLVVAVFMAVLRASRHKGLNILAYAFIAVTLLCISSEGIVSLHMGGSIRLQWSAIGAACVLPVVVVLFFIHYRTKKGRNLVSLFHI